jgi:DNA-binding Lrp family transcriptional regulator
MMDIDEQILRVLNGRKPTDSPMTIGDFARRFGAHPQIVMRAVRRLADSELAEPFMVKVHGVPTLYGLSPARSVATPTASTT